MTFIFGMLFAIISIFNISMFLHGCHGNFNVCTFSHGCNGNWVVYCCLAVCLSADSGETQLTWLKTLEKAGVEVLAENDSEDDISKSARSIHEFRAKDINGQEVDLNRYKWVGGWADWACSCSYKWVGGWADWACSCSYKWVGRWADWACSCSYKWVGGWADWACSYSYKNSDVIWEIFHFMSVMRLDCRDC